MKINFLILAHNLPDQFKLLVSCLQGNENEIFAHIDIKENQEKYFSNAIHFTRKRWDIKWGRIEMVYATQHLIETAYELNSQADYYILLSGQDLPLKPISELANFLSNNIPFSFIHSKPVENEWIDAIPRLSRFHFGTKFAQKLKAKILNLIIKKRTLPLNYTAYGGSQWWCLHASHIEYILNCEKLPQLLTYFKTTLIPDEHFYQTVLENCNFSNSIIKNNLHYMSWDLNSNSPNTLTISNFNELINSEKMFARKFNIKVDRHLVTKITNHIEQGI
jgi:hypothetical protein